MTERSFPISKWLVTRRTGYCHCLHDPGYRSTSHHISYWWVVLIAFQMKNFDVLLFFLPMNKSNGLAKILKMFSY